MVAATTLHSQSRHCNMQTECFRVSLFHAAGSVSLRSAPSWSSCEEAFQVFRDKKCTSLEGISSLFPRRLYLRNHQIISICLCLFGAWHEQPNNTHSFIYSLTEQTFWVTPQASCQSHSLQPCGHGGYYPHFTDGKMKAAEA